MSNLLFYIIFLLAVFAILCVAVRFYPRDAFFTIAIGAVIGSNIYNGIAYPIEIFGLTFGIDAIVYTIFAFCLLMTFIDYGKRNMKIVMYTSMFSIFFTAFLFFMGNLSQNGYSTELLLNFVPFIFSIVATYFGVLAMVWLYERLKKIKVNTFVAIFLGLIMASVVNSFVYFGLSAVVGSFVIEGFWAQLCGSYIGKGVASLCCLGVFACHKIWGKNPKRKSGKKKPDQNVGEQQVSLEAKTVKSTEKVGAKKSAGRKTQNSLKKNL